MPFPGFPFGHGIDFSARIMQREHIAAAFAQQPQQKFIFSSDGKELMKIFTAVMHLPVDRFDPERNGPALGFDNSCSAVGYEFTVVQFHPIVLFLRPLEHAELQFRRDPAGFHFAGGNGADTIINVLAAFENQDVELRFLFCQLVSCSLNPAITLCESKTSQGIKLALEDPSEILDLLPGIPATIELNGMKSHIHA